MTTTPSISDDELLDLVRSVDPIAGEADAAAETTESRVRELLAAARAEHRAPSRTKTRVAVRLAAVGVAGGLAVAAGAALTGGGEGAVTPASAAVIRHAIAALDQPAGTILHVDMHATQDNGDGSMVSWRDVSWQENAAPYSRRQIETSPQGTTAESANVGDDEQVFDPATNTIYQSTARVARQTQPHYRLTPGPSEGTYVLHVRILEIRIKHGHASPEVYRGPEHRLIVTTRQARRLKDGSDVVKWVRRKAGGTHGALTPTVVRAPGSTTSDDADPGSSGFADEIRALLRSGGARVVGHATVHGRDTLEIVSRDRHTTYYVDPSTYSPVELDTRGTDGGTSLFFRAYEFLPDTAANRALLSLAAQHPGATIDRNQADYLAAEKRVFPHG